MKILGNQNKIKLIAKLITKNQFPNSLILIGQKGIGKSLIAQNIALCLTDVISVNELENINNQSNQNILLISKELRDEKKQNKQLIYRDDIAHINEFFKTKSEKNVKRVCVIDSIDDLSIDAVNSLLKIIEEPKRGSEYRGRKLPLYKVVTLSNEGKEINVYQDPFTGEIVAIRSAQWRVWDLMWGLHIMDWVDRENIDNLLLKVFSFLALLTSISGITLFFIKDQYL